MALQLSRKAGESIQIGNVRVTVTRIKGRQVRLAIEAPAEVKILRTELEDENGVESKAAGNAARFANL